MLALPSFGAAGANETIRVAAIGCGWRGGELANLIKKLDNVTLVACADADTSRLDKFVAKHGKMDKYQDYRKMLERDDIDVVYIATPNHWHALHAIHAMQAGKDVYLEKPVTFNLTEGQALLAAREKYGRIVQAGTQNRSDVGLIEAFDYIKSGAIGKITRAKGLCYNTRQSIGKLDSPLSIPPEVDYEQWLGGAQDLPIMRPQLHYDWHWDFNTGNGDIGNQGPHEFDLICWVLGDPLTQGAVRSYGNRYAWNDAGNTANVQAAWWEMKGVPCDFEVTDLWIRPDLKASPAFKGNRVGIIITCEGGEFNGGRGGGFIVGDDGKTKIKKFPGDGGGNHMQNFLDAVRSRKAENLRGKLENAIASVRLAHLANLSFRAGKETPLTQLRAELDHQDRQETIDRFEEQLGNWKIDLEKDPFLLGAAVNVDEAGNVTVGDDPKLLELTKPKYRTGYEVTMDV